VRLFCFPFAGGGAAAYREWLVAAPWLDVCPVEIPGRGERFSEAPQDKLQAMVAVVEAAIDTALDIPFAFFGHSMGALVAFELARRLRAKSRPLPLHLFVSAHRAPQLPRTRRDRATLPAAELREDLQSLNGSERRGLDNEELFELFLPVLRADLAACESYAYENEAPLPCSISVFGGNADAEVSCADLEAWQVHTLASFSVDLFAGGHFFLEQQRTAVLARIQDSLLAAAVRG